MCFNLNIPLVDSGTNGYAAQVMNNEFNDDSVSLSLKGRLLVINVLSAQRIRVSPFALSDKSPKSSFIALCGLKLYSRDSSGLKKMPTILSRTSSMK